MFYLQNKGAHTAYTTVQFLSLLHVCTVVYTVCEYVGSVNKTHIYSTEWTTWRVVDFLVQSLYHANLIQFRNNHPTVLIKSVTKYEDWITQHLNIVCSYTCCTTTCFGQIVQPSSGSMQICGKKVWPGIHFPTDCCWWLCCSYWVYQRVGLLTVWDWIVWGECGFMQSLL